MVAAKPKEATRPPVYIALLILAAVEDNSDPDFPKTREIRFCRLSCSSVIFFNLLSFQDFN